MCVLTDESKTISICNKKTTKQVDIKLVWNLSIIITLFFSFWVWESSYDDDEYGDDDCKVEFVMNIWIYVFLNKDFLFLMEYHVFVLRNMRVNVKTFSTPLFQQSIFFSPLICEKSYSKYFVINLDKHTFIYHVFRLYLYEYLIQLYWIMIISNSIHP